MTGNLPFDWAILAISLANVILLFWLGLTVLLNAEVRTGGVWLVGCALLLGGLFFMAHTAILGIHLEFTDTRLNFWWRAGWLPLVALPYAWYAIVLWYLSTWRVKPDDPSSGSLLPIHRSPRAAPHSPRSTRPTLHLFGFGVATLLFITLALLFSFTSLLPTFRQVITLDFSAAPTLAGIPLLLLLYPMYILLCMVLALAALRSPGPLGATQQDEARRRARPWLIATTVVLLLVSLLVAVLIVGVFVLAQQGALWPAITSVPTNGTLSGAVAWSDLVIAAFLLLATMLVGQAMVSYEIFSGRVLPRTDLRQHWRNAVILATGYSGLASASLILVLPPVYLLLLTTGLITLFYALFGWRTFYRHDELMRQLRPFVRSQHLYEQVMSATSLDDEIDLAFQALCTQVLKTDYAVLAPLGSLAPLIQQPWTFPSHASAPQNLITLAQSLALSPSFVTALDANLADPARYAVALWGERGLSGLLLLGGKRDGGLYTQEELEVAQAIGERLIDTRASTEIARRLFLLQRQRLAESQLLDRQTRRTLHDEILPELHTALLALSQADPTLEPVQSQLATMHRQISNLLRNQQPATTPLLTQGLLPALRRLLDEEMRGLFDDIRYLVDEQAAAVADDLNDLEREVLYYAVRELVRNAARHGRGVGEARPLHLQVTIRTAEAGRGLLVCVEDDGIGLTDPTCLEQGRGLTLHRTLLAILGATLEGQSQPNGGVQMRIVWRRST